MKTELRDITDNYLGSRQYQTGVAIVRYAYRLAYLPPVSVSVHGGEGVWCHFMSNPMFLLGGMVPERGYGMVPEGGRVFPLVRISSGGHQSGRYAECILVWKNSDNSLHASRELNRSFKWNKSDWGIEVTNSLSIYRFETMLSSWKEYHWQN